MHDQNTTFYWYLNASDAAEKKQFLFPNDEAGHTFSELRAQSKLAAKGLLALGLKKGDCISIWAPNCAEWICAFYAAQSIGLICSGVSTFSKADEVMGQLHHSKSKALILAEGIRENEFLDMLEDQCPVTKEQRELTPCLKGLPDLKQMICIGAQPLPDGMLSWEALLELGESYPETQYREKVEAVRPDDIAVLQYTSGVTGKPKAAMLTQYTMLKNGKAFFDRAFAPMVESGEALYAIAPCFHMLGLCFSMLAPIYYQDSITFVFTRYFHPKLALEIFSNYRCTGACGVPAMFALMLRQPNLQDYALHAGRWAFVSGGQLSKELVAAMNKGLHLPKIVHLYGATETPAVACKTLQNGSDEDTITVGTPLEGNQCKLVSLDTGETLADGTAGELCIKGFTLEGYYCDGKIVSAHDADGWYHSRDLARCTETGEYQILGRIDEMILRGGENIDPYEIEQALKKHPQIQDACVIGVPSRTYGQEIAAFVISAGVSASQEEIQSFCRQALSAFKVPRWIRSVPSFPYNGAGKVEKDALRTMLCKEGQDGKLK